jgi:hypothetical protein
MLKRIKVPIDSGILDKIEVYNSMFPDDKIDILKIARESL